MSDKMIAKLNARLDRRSFLRGSSLLVAAVGASLVLPATAGAQTQTQPPTDTPNDTASPDAQKAPESKDAPKDTPDQPAQQAKEGDGAQTLKDFQGREYRVCPQCGSNMYRQGRTWTCENCGYSYDE